MAVKTFVNNQERKQYHIRLIYDQVIIIIYYYYSSLSYTRETIIKTLNPECTFGNKKVLLHTLIVSTVYRCFHLSYGAARLSIPSAFPSPFFSFPPSSCVVISLFLCVILSFFSLSLSSVSFSLLRPGSYFFPFSSAFLLRGDMITFYIYTKIYQQTHTT